MITNLINFLSEGHYQYDLFDERLDDCIVVFHPFKSTHTVYAPGRFCNIDTVLGDNVVVAVFKPKIKQNA